MTEVTEPIRATDDEHTVRSRVRELLSAYEPRWSVRCDSWMRSFDIEFSKRLAAARMIGVTWPVEAGGAGASNTLRLAITEELLRVGAPVAGHWVADRQIGPAVLRHASEALRAKILPGIVAGETTFCLGMSEPDSGSDLAAIKTRAVHDPETGGYRITGVKIWTSNAHRTSHAYVLARTEVTGKKHEGLTEFIVPMDAEGLSTRPILDLAGEHHFNETVFDNVHVPAENVIGTVGQGWQQVTEQLAFERGGAERYLSTYPVLAAIIGEAQLADPAEEPLHVRGVGAVVAELVAVRGLAAQVTRRIDAGEAPITEAAQLKLVGTALEKEILRLGADVASGPAVPSAGGLPGLVADGLYASPGGSLRGGTSEILLSILARTKPSWPGHDDPEIADLMTATAGAVSGLVPTYPEIVGAQTVWDFASELGWHRIGTPEEQGGSGGGVRDLVAVVEAASASGLPVPFAAAAGASFIASSADKRVEHEDLTAWASFDDVLNGRVEGANLILNGVLNHVANASLARDVLVAVEVEGLVHLLRLPVDLAGVRVDEQQDLAGESADRVHCADVVVSVSEAISSVHFSGGRTLQRLLRTARVVGLSRGALDQVRAHVEVRQQFGRPLVAFQTISHRLAYLESRVAVARAALWSSVTDNPDPDRVLAALTCVLGTIWDVATAAHQLLGAMGTTLEHPLHRYTLRLHACRAEGERLADLEAKLGAAVLQEGESATWDWLVGMRPHLRSHPAQV